jgi:hypothetical protein
MWDCETGRARGARLIIAEANDGEAWKRGYHSGMATVERNLGTSDEEIVRKAVESEARMPAIITSYKVESTYDHEGEPTTLVTFYVKQGTPAGMETGKILHDLSSAIRERSRALGATHFQHFRFGKSA